jgi:hypothetical protein
MGLALDLLVEQARVYLAERFGFAGHVIVVPEAAERVSPDASGDERTFDELDEEERRYVRWFFK